MVDELAQETPAPIAEQAAARPGFFSTPTGKAVAIGGGAAAVLFVVAAVGIAVYVFVLGNKVEETVQRGAQGVATPATVPGKAASAPKPAVEPKEVALREVFTFRDVFAPLIDASAPAPAAAGDTAGEGEGGETTGTAGGEAALPGTLYLQDVSTQDGEAVANLTLDGTEYALAEGDALGTTPWEVLSIEDDTVVMLYGDDRVTLTVGQGISK